MNKTVISEKSKKSQQ